MHIRGPSDWLWKCLYLIVGFVFGLNILFVSIFIKIIWIICIIFKFIIFKYVLYIEVKAMVIWIPSIIIRLVKKEAYTMLIMLVSWSTESNCTEKFHFPYCFGGRKVIKFRIVWNKFLCPVFWLYTLLLVKNFLKIYSKSRSIENQLN